MKKLISLTLALTLSLFALPALADTVEMSGTVVNVSPVILSFDAAGTAAAVNVSAGDRVAAGEVLASLKVTPVYASAPGVAHVFAQTGDSVEDLTTRYGGVVIVEPEVRYTLSCSSSTAYDAEANRIIHPGETVYVKGISNASYTGSGVVTLVSGNSYTVELNGKDFVSGNSFYIYREPDFAAASKLGKGSISRAAYALYTGEGIVSRLAVKEGDTVQKGDLLYETVSAAYTGNTGDCTVVTAPEAGIIAELSVTAGTAVTDGTLLGTLYPDTGLRVKAYVDEEGLAVLSEGKQVSVSFTYSENSAPLTGTVEKISFLGEADPAALSEETFYPVIVSLSDATGFRYGMNVIVSAE